MAKRKENQKEQNYKNALKEAPDKIRAELGDEFFKKYIGISETQIRQFIVFCQFSIVFYILNLIRLNTHGFP